MVRRKRRNNFNWIIKETNNGKTTRNKYDIVQDNIEKLKQIFPEIFTEGKIDFQVLKQLLGEHIENDKERYSFTWKGKTQARQIAQDMSTGTLRPDRDNSKIGKIQRIFI